MNELSIGFLIFSVLLALIFDFLNGFHDAANSIATVVSTRVLKPIHAVVWAAFFNLIAMVIFGPRVAETVSHIVTIEPGNSLFAWVVLAGLIGAIIWDVITWFLGLPTSSSHALIGGLSGAGLAFGGIDILHWKTILVIIEFIFLSPVIGFILASFLVTITYRLFKNWRPGHVDRFFRKGQLVSAALYSIGHGANDAQKTMGIILALLIAAGYFSSDTVLSLYHPDTAWIVLSCQAAISLGTLFGGWRIVKTMGMRITKLKPIGGFCAETSGAATLFAATLWGIPVSTTHTITGSIIGVGYSTTSASQVKWGIAKRIVWAWVLTIPGSGLISAAIFLVKKDFF
jgi:inorganic phosphate transporter, PiT family